MPESVPVYSDPSTGVSPIAAAVVAALGGGKKVEGKTVKKAAPVPTGGPKARSVDQILAARRARLAKAQERYEPGADVLEAVVTLLEEEAVVVNEHAARCRRRDQLRKEHGSPTAVRVENDAVAELESTKAQYEVDLDAIRKAEGGDRIVEAALQRMDLRRKAEEVSESLAGLDSKNTKAEEFAKVLGEAVGVGAFKAGAGPIEWAGQKYGPAVEGDPVIDQLVMAFVDFIAARKAAVDERRSADDVLAAPRMISEEEAAHLKIHPETSRTLKGFLGGEGTRYFLPVFDNGRHIGNALLERENGKIFCRRVAAKYPPLALKLFFPFDKDEGKRKARGDAQIDARTFKKGDDEAVFDFDRVKNNLIRTALQTQLDREKASEAKREHAAELRDITKIDNPIIFADLRFGTKGIWPVSIPKWSHQVGGRNVESPVTFQVIGTGDKNFMVGQMVEGTDVKIPWLAEFINPQPLRRLDEKGWRAIAGKNSWFDRDWVLAREATKRNATPLNRESAAGLFDLDGADGLYAVRARWYRKPDSGDPDRHGMFKPVGYIVERSGSTLKVVWAMLGLSAGLAAEDKEDEPAFFERELKIAALHPLLRAVLRSAYMAIHGLHGREGHEQVPLHLRPADKAEDEGNGSNGNGHDE